MASASNNPTPQVEGFVSFIEGMNAGTDPSVLKDTQYSRGINISTRSGLIHTRPGFVRVCDLPPGKFCGCGRWSLNAGDLLVVVIGATVAVYNSATDSVTEFRGLLPSKTQAFFCQADEWLVIQNGSDDPVVLKCADGVVTVFGRTAPTVCFPKATIMQYLNGRVHMVPVKVPALTPDPLQTSVVPDTTDEDGRMTFVSGDVRDIYQPDWLFRMTEHRTAATGGGMSMPMEFGFIGGMGAFRNSATGTGAGALIVIGREGVSAFDTGVPRSQWKNTQIGQVLFSGVGTCSPWSVFSVNDDLWFRGLDGLRSVRYSKSLLGGSGASLSTVPMSTEVWPWLDSEEGSALPFISGCFAGNRIVFTSNGVQQSDGDWAFRGLVVLDTAMLSSFGRTTNPAYDGLYTGYRFMQVLAFRHDRQLAVHAVVKTRFGHRFIRLDEQATTDEGTLIQAQLQTRAFSFSSILLLKEFSVADLWLTDISEPTAMSVFFKPDDNRWVRLADKSFLLPAGSQPQTRRRSRFPLDFSHIPGNLVSGELLHRGNEFQLALVWTGHCQIDKCRMEATVVADPPPNICAETAGVVVPEDATFSDFSYEVPT